MSIFLLATLGYFPRLPSRHILSFPLSNLCIAAKVTYLKYKFEPVRILLKSPSSPLLPCRALQSELTKPLLVAFWDPPALPPDHTHRLPRQQPRELLTHGPLESQAAIFFMPLLSLPREKPLREVFPAPRGC